MRDSPTYSYLTFRTFELLLVFTLLCVLVALGARAYLRSYHQAQLAHAAGMLLGARAELSLFHDLHGRWPRDRDELAAALGTPLALDVESADPRAVQGLVLEQGAVHVQLGEIFERRVLSYRPLVSTRHPGAPVRWSCAPGVPGAGWRAAGEDRTTLDSSRLPGYCRQRPQGELR